MEKIYELQHRALEKMTKNTCEIARVLDQIRATRNGFDIEAKVYSITWLAMRLEMMAREIHTEMHKENSTPSEPHDDACLSGPRRMVVPIDSVALEKTLREDGWTMNATDFILNAIRGKNG